jgi:virulence factor Mce-like protein
MRTRRGFASEIFDNPILVGTITILVVTIAVYLSYIAENGLPFSPSYTVNVDVTNAAELVKNAPVRIGGALVGQVLTITPEPAGADPGYHRPFARLQLRLQRSLEPLPYDTRYEVRTQSALGAKYVELLPGRDHNTRRTPALLDGGTFRLGTKQKHNIAIVDLSDAFRVFGPATAHGLRGALYGLGDAVAGRGAQFNDTIYQLRRLISPLESLLRLLASPSTNLPRFISGAAATTGALAPVAPTISALLANGAKTFAALSRSNLGQAIDQLPPTESVATTVLTNARPVLVDTASLVQALKPGAALLPLAAHRLDQIVRAATPVYHRVPRVASALEVALGDVQLLARNPASTQVFTVLGNNDLATFGASMFVGLGAILEAAAPAQLGCNIEGLWARDFGGPNSPLSEGDALGTWLRTDPLIVPQLSAENNKPWSQLHLNFYPVERAGHCEAGNLPYTSGQQIGNPQGFSGGRVPHTSPPPGVTKRYKKAGLEGTYR